MTTAIPRDTVVDALVDRLRRDVLSGRYPPGSYLPPERELAGGYQVTRTSLKHALVRLVQAGLLETRHGVGTRVRDYERFGGPELLPMLVTVAGAEWMTEIFEARREVGALIAGSAAANAGAEYRERLGALLEELRTAPDAATAQRTECEIHRVVAAASRNRVYRLMVNALLGAYMEVREAFRHAFADPAESAARIEPLIREIVAGRPDAARDAAREYFARTQELMLAPAPGHGAREERP